MTALMAATLFNNSMNYIFFWSKTVTFEKQERHKYDSMSAVNWIKVVTLMYVSSVNYVVNYRRVGGEANRALCDVY